MSRYCPNSSTIRRALRGTPSGRLLLSWLFTSYSQRAMAPRSWQALAIPELVQYPAGRSLCTCAFRYPRNLSFGVQGRTDGPLAWPPTWPAPFTSHSHRATHRAPSNPQAAAGQLAACYPLAILSPPHFLFGGRSCRTLGGHLVGRSWLTTQQAILSCSSPPSFSVQQASLPTVSGRSCRTPSGRS